MLAFGLVLTISRGALIGLALALAAWPWLKARWSWTRQLKICAVTLLACAAAATLVTFASPQVRERFTQLVRESGELSRPVLWRAAWNLWLEKPVAGTGAGSFNVAFERHRPARFLDEPQWAHNDYLNTLSDYGVIGFALFFGAIGAIAWRAVRGASATRKMGDSSERRLGAVALLGRAGTDGSPAAKLSRLSRGGLPNRQNETEFLGRCTRQDTP